MRAMANASPPLFPGPAKILILGTSLNNSPMVLDRANAARSISSMDWIPSSSIVRRSNSFIWIFVNIFIKSQF